MRSNTRHEALHRKNVCSCPVVPRRVSWIGPVYRKAMHHVSLNFDRNLESITRFRQASRSPLADAASESTDLLSSPFAADQIFTSVSNDLMSVRGSVIRQGRHGVVIAHVFVDE